MRWVTRGLMMVLTLSAASTVPAQRSPVGQQPSPAPQAQPGEDAVVATVNGDPITLAELEAKVREEAQGRQLAEEAAEQLRKQSLEMLIENRLIEQYVLKEGPPVDRVELQSAVQRVKKDLADQDVEFQQFLESQGHTEERFVQRVQGALAWEKFQKQQMTPDTLQAYFEKHADRFKAKSLAEARQEVIQAYTTSLWQAVVRRMQPGAEIVIAKPAGAPRPGSTQPPLPAPKR